MNLRANSPAFYVTFGGIPACAVGYVDDSEHYGKGIDDLVQIMEEIRLGSIATGIGLAWCKFIAFAADWNQNDQNKNPTVLPNGIEVLGWDTWKGGYIHATVSRAYADTTEPLLVKRGTIQDQHTLAAMDTIKK